MTVGSSSMLTGYNDTSLVRQQLTWKVCECAVSAHCACGGVRGKVLTFRGSACVDQGEPEIYCCASGNYPNGTHCTLGWDSPIANQLIGTEGRQFAPGVEVRSACPVGGGAPPYVWVWLIAGG